jgi:hypothetical protein
MSRHWRPILRLFSLFYLRFTFIAMTVKDYVYWTGYEIASVGEAGEVISYLAISRAWGQAVGFVLQVILRFLYKGANSALTDFLSSGFSEQAASSRFFTIY